MRKILTIIAVVAAVIFLLWGGLHLLNRSTGFRPMPSDDGAVSKETYTPEVPLQTLNKQQAYKHGMISKSTTKDNTKKVLASGNISDDSGTHTVTAVLDVKSGETKLIEHRPIAEFMSRNSLGAGYTIGTLGIGWTAEYQHTFARLWIIYPEARVNAWAWTAGERMGKLDAQVTGMITVRW